MHQQRIHPAFRGTALPLLFLVPLMGAGACVQAAQADSGESPSQPVVLVLGDSISIGYTPFLADELSDVATVIRPMINEKRAENCQGTKNGVRKVDDWLARAGTPDVITFNFGLHDLKREHQDDQGNAVASTDPSDPPQADPETYRKNLIAIVKKLEATGAKLFLVTTTPVPPGGVEPHRDLGDPLIYNAIARQVAEPRGIDVIDLNALVSKNPTWMRPVNVHYTDKGSAKLAAAIATPVRKALATIDEAKRRQIDPDHAPPWHADPAVVKASSRRRSTNFEESSVSAYTLPDPLAGSDGEPVGEEGWPTHREATLSLFRDHVYGTIPPEAQNAKLTYRRVDEFDGLRVTAARIEAKVTAGQETFSFPFLLSLPKEKSQQPYPAIIVIQNRTLPGLVDLIEQPSPFVPVDMIAKRGYAVAVFHTSHVDPDRKNGFDDGVRGLFARAAIGPKATAQNRKPNDWGAIAAWSWGASRVLDYLETIPEIDANHVAVIGHSRGGKTAAWTAARDPRFAAALVNNSGSGGAALFRRRFGETIAHSIASFPYWYAAAFADFTDREDQLPVDQHQLMGLIAPRAVAVSSADEDLWADPRGEYLSLVHAAPVYSLLGTSSITQESMPPLAQPRVVGPTGYRIRPGAHDLQEGDWAFYLDFLDGQWKGTAKTLPPQ